MFVLALTTCTDNPTAPGHGGRAFLALQPVLTHPVDLLSFGLTIDSLRVTVVRPVADTVADTTVYFSPDSSEIHLRIPVVLRAAVESLGVHLALSAGGVVLFTGADTVPVSVASGGGGGGGSPVIVPLSYSGPGAGVDRLIVTPVDTALKLSDSLRYRVAAEQGGVPVPSFYVRWTTSDTTRARISAFGVLRAPNHRDTITVIARTITGVSDSTRVTFVPTPTALAVAGGNGQTDTIGRALAVPLRVRVTASDLLGVKGVVVSFTAVTAGASVGTPSAVTNDSGFAQTIATLGSTAGPQQFGASVAGLTPVTFTATALASTVHSTDITANETWTAAQSPHVVTAYLRVRNNATLTIAAGAVVKFDPGAGLQIGDTALGESGGLVLDGTAAAITLTANSGSPASGFWKGLEVQKRLGGPAWRRVLVEWGGGIRAGFGGNGPCILVADRTGAALDLDSLHVRQCGGAGGVVVVDGSVHLHRSVVDSTGLAGIAATNGVIEVDSTTFRGVTTGVQLSNTTARLGPSSANQFLGNGVPIQLHAFQLPGLLRQDTIAGNTTNHIIVTTGQPDPAAPVVTLYRQPRGPTGFDYEVTGGGAPLSIGRPSGQQLVLDSNVVVAFDRGGGLLIGDSVGGRSGTIRSLGTSGTNAPRLTSAQTVPAAGDWVGVDLGFLTQDDTLKHLRIEYAGDTATGRSGRVGLFLRSPVFRTVLDSVVVAHSGLVGDTTSSAVAVGPAGAGVEIRRSTADSNPGIGFLIAATPVRLVDGTARGNYIGVSGFIAGGGRILADSAAGTPDSIAGNVLGPGNRYALQLFPGSLPMLYANTVTGNLRDTLLLGFRPAQVPPGPPSKTQGPLPGDPNSLLVPATLPQVPGQRWRVLSLVVIDSTGFLKVNPDTVVFDSSAAVIIGGRSPAAVVVDGANRAPDFYKLLTATPGHPRWGGIDFRSVTSSGLVFRKATIEKAGQFIPPPFGCDCNGTAIAGIRVSDASAVTFSLDSLIVRRSITIALDVNRGTSAANVAVLGSQFYQNSWSPMIKSPDPRQLVIHGSDLYHYHSQAIQSSFAGTDSVDAGDNWWGDVDGPWRGFSFQDSLGRASFDGNAVRFLPIATSRHFASAIGPASALVAARDTFIPAGDTVLSVVGQSDSLRVRVVDLQGRGVGGQGVLWTPTSGTIDPPSSSADLGGRVGAAWHLGPVAGQHTATATAVGAPVVFPLNVLPGNTVGGVNWQLDPGFTLGAVAADSNAVTFTSTNRRARVLGNARDGHGNATSPNEFCFADPGGPCAFGYGQVDSLSGGNIYFRSTTNTPPTFILRGLYEFGAGGQDSVRINMNAVASRVRIDRNVFTPGSVDTLPDPVVFRSLCRNGFPPGGQCQQEFQAFVVDSENAPVGNAAARFVWLSPPSPDTAVTITSTRGAPANDTAFVQAHDNGPTWVVVVDSLNGLSPTFRKRDSIPIVVQQQPVSVVVTPDTISKLLGEQVAFRAHVADPGGDTVRTAQVHWRIGSTYAGTLTILDTSTTNQVTVQLDSVVDGSAQILAWYCCGTTAPNDTLFGAGRVRNPVISNVAAGDPVRLAFNSTLRHAYVTDGVGGSVHVFDMATETGLGDVTGLPGANGIAANPRTGKVFVTRSDGTLSQIDDGLRTVMSRTFGQDLGFVAVDTLSFTERVFVPAADSTGRYWLYRFSSNADSLFKVDSAPMTSRGNGVAYNPISRRVYVVQNNEDSLAVFDANGALTLVAKIGLGAASYDVAVNAGQNRIYVTESTAQQLKVIAGGSNTPIDSISIGFNVYPQGVDFDPARNRIYVARPGSGFPSGGVTIIYDDATNPLRYISFSGILSPWVVDVKADPTTGRVYGLDTGSRSLIILHFTP